MRAHPLSSLSSTHRRVCLTAHPTGIVTKPDLLGSGSSGAKRIWKEIFEGRDETHRLQLGYYCVRLPQDSERAQGMTPQQLQQVAMRFFRSSSPWKNLQVPNRVGTDNVVRDMSQLLVRMLSDA